MKLYNTTGNRPTSGRGLSGGSAFQTVGRDNLNILPNNDFEV
jgi:hypothetical protein